MAEEPTKEDYYELQKKYSDLVKQNEGANKNASTGADTMKQMQATIQAQETKLQAQEKEMDENKEKVKALEDEMDERDEKEKQGLAAKIAQAEVMSGKIKEASVSERAASLAKDHSASVLAAMLPYAEGEAKVASENSSLKQAAAKSANRYVMDDTEPDNKQAAESQSFLKAYRGRMYT